MCWCYKQTAFLSGDIQITENHFPYILGCAEEHGALGTDGTVEGQYITVLCVDFSEFHTFRLDGVENIDPGFYQMGDQFRYVTAGMVDDDDIRVNGFACVDEPFQSGVSAIRRTALRSS